MAQMAYITLEEAAELEGIKYNTLVQKIGRKRDAYETRTVKTENGGRDLVLVAVNTLSKQARNAWKERERLRALAAEPEDTGAKEPEQQERPWYVDTDIDWYMHQYSDTYYKGVEIGNVVREFLAYDEAERTEFAERFAQERLGKGARTLYRYTKSYLEALAWQDKLEKENGCKCEYFRILCLCRKPKDVGKFPSFSPEVKQTIKNIWFDEGFAGNRGTREMLYEKLEDIQKLKGWERIPSYQSVVRYIAWLMEDEGMKNAHYLAANGIRDYKNRKMQKKRRDTKGLEVMEIVQGDEHTFDCWVTVKAKNGKAVPIRPKLVCWLDTRSRWILGDVMCRDANAQILKQSLMKLIYHDAGSVPKYLYIDNGKDYTAKEMIGVDRKDRHNQEVKDEHFAMAFDDATRGFYRAIGIEDEHIAMPYEPWTKGQIERFFETVCGRFTKWLASYTGTLTGSLTSAKVNKDIRRMAEQGKLLTLEEFYEYWTTWKMEKYSTRKHTELRKAGEEYTTPLALFENGERYFKAPPAKGQATMLMMKEDRVRVYNTGIERLGHYYMDEDGELIRHIGESVTIKWDPDDVTSIYVFDKKGKLICEAASQELLQFGTVSDDVLREHRRRQNAQVRRDREILKEATTPFEELNGQEGIRREVAGMDGLMIGKIPKSKQVQFPDSRMAAQNYREMKKERVSSRYMSAQANKALERLKTIGGA